VSTRFAYGLVLRGEIESIKLGRSRRIPVEAIARYIESLRQDQ